MQTILNEFKKSKNSVLSLDEDQYDFFYTNIVEVPLLEQILAERAINNSYYPALYRDIWFMIEQPYEIVQFSEKVDFSNEVLSQILKAVYEHPTFHIIHEISEHNCGNSFVCALLLTEMVAMMIDSEIESIFSSDEQSNSFDLQHFIDEQLAIGNCLECAAHTVLHSMNELPIYVDMDLFSQLPLAERTNHSLQIFTEMNLMDEVDTYKSIYL